MPPSLRVLPPALAALGVAALLSLPGEARADDDTVPSGGISLSLSFGQKLAFGLGLDFRVTSVVDEDPRLGIGPFLQATWLNFSAFRFAAGVHGGGQLSDDRGGYSALGELGWTYRTRYSDELPGQHGIHVGVLNSIGEAVAFDLSLRAAIPLSAEPFTPEGTVGLGLRAPPPLWIGQEEISGRPLRTAHGVVLPPAIALGRRGAPRPARLDRATRGALAAAWLDTARAECGSIPAFLALARDLAAVGAPASLVQRAAAAADDEVRHAARCSDIASALAGWRVAPVLLPPPPARDVDRRAALVRLALEAWHDGCLGEGAAAARARRSLPGASDAAVKATLGEVARDEARHAELGWRVLAYCLAEGGRDVREAVGDAITGPAPAPAEASEEIDGEPKETRAFGQPSRAEADAAWDETWTAARRDGERLLDAA
ncbi:uncharacterized protein SOCE26_035640 [Sorangium cellulosum]|uniref:Ferritin-like domain-containing protein n=1 Tax=Sorangium cellulosum TaxID=56 RepID=A0A2L0ES49_SORCE|nr:hypothetical protein [Sorangium cellulosum]AUX42137.1 uncharacterized protein SOCE26_035640 [Sorangium cellulosum]